MFECIKLMKREAEPPAVYEDTIHEVGAPDKMVTDNAKVLPVQNRRRLIDGTV